MANHRGIHYVWGTPESGDSGFSGRLSNDSSRVEALFYVTKTDDFWDTIKEFVGWPLVRGAGSAFYVSRQTPHALQDMLDFHLKPWLFCVEVQIQGIDPVPNLPRFPNGWPQYRAYRCRGVWSSLTYEVLEDGHPAMAFVPDPLSYGDLSPDFPTTQPNPLAGLPDEASLNRFVTKWPKGFNRMITIPRAVPKFVLEGTDKSAGTDQDGFTTGPVVFEGIGKPEPGEVRHYTWHQVPRDNLPVDAFRKAAGAVNRYAFDGFPAGTLLADMPDVVPYKSAAGQRLADVHFQFRFLAKVGLDGNYKGWEYLFRVAEQTTANPRYVADYRRVTTDGRSGAVSVKKRIFRTFDFAELFRPVAGA